MAQPSVHQLFRRLETVGKGAYGSVHKGIHVPTGNIVALKIINLDTADDDVEAIQREVALLTQLRDAPNVTKYYGCYLDGPRVWIVMEFAQGGSVRTLMQTSKDGVLEERFIVIIIREVLAGLSYLHKSAIIHRDIKAANILITASGKVMICDFGVSALSVSTTTKRNTLMGTPNWMAPEVAQPTPVYDSKADIWSLGIMTYEMVKGAPPHSDLRDAIKVMQLIARIKPPRLGEGDGSKDMRDFVSHCLRESPNDRLSADELSKTKWIKAASKLNVAILKELIHRYEVWMQGGGARASLAEPLEWESEEKRDLESIVEQDEELWEFDTIKDWTGKSLKGADDGLPSSSSVEPSAAASTVQQSTSHLPTSLRGLFDDETGITDTLKAPSFPPPSSQRSTPSPTVPIPPVPSSPGEGVLPRRRLAPEFPFPTSPPVDNAASPGPSAVSTHSAKTHNRISPNHISTPNLTQSMHRPRSSLDATLPSGLPPRPPHPPPLSISRAWSTNAADTDSSLPAEGPSLGALIARKPSLNRQASVAVMESTPISPLLPPIRPFAARERSGSSSSKGSDGSSPSRSLLSPGLKDAVKVPALTSEHQLGMTDLLPPSPSSLAHITRPFTQSPSLLGSITTGGKESTSFPLGSRADANASTISLPNPSTSTSGLAGHGKVQSARSSHGASRSLTSVPVELACMGPPVLPVDLCSLMGSHEATNAHLARTVDDLTKWFGVLEVGFANMLEQPLSDSIEEEQEESMAENQSIATVDETSPINIVRHPPQRSVTVGAIPQFG